LIDKTERAVKERLTRAINYWDQRAIQLRLQEEAGKFHARLNSRAAQQRADDLQARLQQRLAELALERQISASPPIVTGGALIVPLGWLLGRDEAQIADTRRSEMLAMEAVLEAEARLGNKAKDISSENRGYDIESRGRDGRLRFIEVKGRQKNAADITLTRNELLCALNSREQFILAIVEIEAGAAREPRYVRNFPFQQPANFITGMNVKLRDLLAASRPPG